MPNFNIVITDTRFPLGQVVSTGGAASKLTQGDIQTALDRHTQADWGDLDAEDKASNDRALKSGEDRLFSVYHAMNGTKFWIITEWDRSVTTILLPSEY